MTRECVLAVVDSQQRATCLTLTAEQLGPDTPEALFKQAVVKKTYSKSLPGSVLELKTAIDGIDPGYFVFLCESGNEFVIARAGEDEGGQIVASDEQHVVHVDFAGEFEATEINLLDGKVDS